LVLSSPEPLFFSYLSVLDAYPVHGGFVASLEFVFLLGFVLPTVSAVACLGFFGRLRLRSGEIFHEARVVPRVPFTGRPMRSPTTEAGATIHPHASG
jgi:hypothetical protein